MLARGVSQARRGCFFQNLLVTALSAAVALAEGDDLTLAVAEDLNLDVAGAGDVAFEIHRGVAEVRVREADDGVVRVFELGRAVADAHADAAASAGAFEHDGIAQGVRLRERVTQIGKDAGAGQQRHAAGLGRRASSVLEREGVDVLGRWPDEDDATSSALTGEGDVLREEAIARVDGLCASLRDGGEDGFERKIALRGWRRSDEDGFVGFCDVQ